MGLNRKLLSCCLAVLSLLAVGTGEGRVETSRGVVHIKARQADGAMGETQLYQASHALIVGVSDYSAGWPKLPGVAEDVVAVEAALRDNGFEVSTVLDPDAAGLDAAFQGFIAKYGFQPENRLLFYFSGHGHTMEPAWGGDPIGYIVPRDAPSPLENPQEFKRLALSMQRIEEYSLDIDAKHALFLFDSCFSGALFALSRAIPEDVSYKTSRPVRQFITSGSDEEQVPDKSVFRGQFVAALKGEADSNNDGYVTGTELGSFLQDTVANYSKGSQHPQYGKLRNPKLDKGDFVFLPTGDHATTRAAGPAAGPTPAAGSGAETAALDDTAMDRLVGELARRFKEGRIEPPAAEDPWNAAPRPTLVFLDVRVEGLTEARRDFILGRVSEELRASGRYRIVEREIIDKLLAELELSNSDLADSTTALKIGRVLSARLIATGSMLRQENEWLVNLRFIETETTAIRTSVSSLINGDDTAAVAAETARSIASSLGREFPLRTRLAELTKDGAFIDAGSAGGVTAGMVFELLDEQNRVVAEVTVASVEPERSRVEHAPSASLVQGMRAQEKR